MSDLIERLRDKKRLRAAHGLTGWVLADESLHTEAADEIERLTAALQHEADCVEAAKEEIERLTAALQYEQHRAGRQGTHGDGCADWGPEHYECAIRERDELRRQLDPMGEYASADELIAALRAEKAEDEAMKLDAQRYRWLRPRFFAADFAYSDPPVCAIVFRWPESAKISANLDREIDAAMGASNE